MTTRTRGALPRAFATKTLTSTCVVWIGSTNNKGYGIVWVDGECQLAHRVAYEAANGPIPDGLVIDHLCRVRNCVKPEHLEAVTYSENSRRGRATERLEPGVECTNGHFLHDGDIYTRPNGKTECRHCRRDGQVSNNLGAPRKTRQLRAGTVAAAVAEADNRIAAAEVGVRDGQESATQESTDTRSIAHA